MSRAARVGLATCAALPSGDPDDAYLIEALERAGVAHTWIEWNTADPTSLSDAVDVLVLRSPWDYPDHHAKFLQWLESSDVPVHNAADVVRWNSNKKYLLDLAAAGVPTVPTQIIESVDQDWRVPEGFAEFVVKPAIGVGSKGAQRFFVSEIDRARAHASMLIDAGRPAMVQPYLPSVDAGSETALIHFDGVFSHSITKGPMLTKDVERAMASDLYVIENIEPRQATAKQLEVGQRALAAIPVADRTPLYARVDVIDDESGDPVVLELELIEPSLFFAFDPPAADRYVSAIVGRLEPRTA